MLFELMRAFPNGEAALAYADAQDVANAACRRQTLADRARAWVQGPAVVVDDPLWMGASIGRAANRLAWIASRCGACGRCPDMTA